MRGGGKGVGGLDGEDDDRVVTVVSLVVLCSRCSVPRQATVQTPESTSAAVWVLTCPGGSIQD